MFGSVMKEKATVPVPSRRPVDRTLLVLAALAIAAAVASSVSFRAVSQLAPGGPSVADERRTTPREGSDTAPAGGPAEAAPATQNANEASPPTVVFPLRDGAPQPVAAPGMSADTTDPAAPAQTAPGSVPASTEGRGRPELVTDGLPPTVPQPPPDPKLELRQ